MATSSDLPSPFLDPSLQADYAAALKKQQIAQSLQEAFQRSNQNNPQWNGMALIPRRGLAQNVASLVTALGAGKYKREADKANADYMQKYNAPEPVAQTAAPAAPGVLRADQGPPIAAPAPAQNKMIPEGMDHRTAQMLVSTLGPAEYTKQFLAPNFKLSDFDKDLRSAGLQPGTPEYTKALQAKVAKDTYLPAQEVSATADLIDPITHEVIRKGAAPAQASHVEWKDVGDKLMPVDSITGQAVPGLQPMAKKDTPAGARVSFSGQRSDLLAALASKGVSLPAGLRSQSQMAATIDGLLAKYPQNTPDEIADRIATGQIDFGAAKKETQISAGQAGKVAVAVNELSTFGDQVLEASKAVPRGSFIPLNKLMQMTDAQISDPALINYKVKMQSLNNAYDTLAARGGTDADKRAHVHALFNTATSQEGVDALVKALKDEGRAAKEAADKATKTDKYGQREGEAVPVPTQNAQGWTLHTDAKGNKAYVSPDGKQFEEVR
jgi:hypothetical protein